MFHKSLEFKIISLIVLTLCIAFGGIYFVSINRFEKDLRQEEEVKSDLMAVGVIEAIKNMMILGDAPIVVKMAEELKKRKTVVKLGVYRKNGYEAFLDNESRIEVNKFLLKDKYGSIEDPFPLRTDLKEIPLQFDNPPKLQEVLQSQKKIGYQEKIDDKPVLTQLFPVIRDQVCNNCHGYDQHPVRAVLLISTSLVEFNQTINKFKNSLIVIFLFTIILVVLLLRASLKVLILNPVFGMINTMKEISEGNILKQVEVKTEDEMGQLALWFNKMSANIRLVDILKQIKGNVERTNTAADQISSVSEQQKESASEQALSITEITSTTEELSVSSRQVFNKSEVVSHESEEALAASSEGQKMVKISIEKMAGIRKKVEIISEHILNLSEQTQQIGTIIKTVNEIAQKTDMLAINAAIEASKAGEQGKGFGVVAAEIRKLADQSQKATLKITSLIEDIQSATSNSVMVTEEGCKDCELGLKLILDTGKAINSVIERIRETVTSSREISISSKQQSLATEQVSEAMSIINQGMKSSVDGAGKMHTASESLRGLAREMKEILEKYKF